MRITNSIINNNSLYNINNNKVYMDELNTQMATEKKINNPSDDPIIAVRALRLRSSLSEITQYYSKNVPDAVSWVETTGTAIDTTLELMRSLKAEYTDGSNDPNTPSDRETILENIRALKDQIYATGNSTNEDRYIFTGFRTSVSLTFTEEDFNIRENATGAREFKYTDITENFTIDDVESYQYVSGAITNGNIADYKNIHVVTPKVDETAVKNHEMYRLRLAYNAIDKMATANKLVYDGGDYTPQFISSADEAVLTPAENTVYVNYETGNIIFDEKVREKLAGATNITFSYDKSTWNVRDLKPEHYFNCDEKGSGATIEYREHQQEINFTVSTGQKVKINTNADEVFDPGIGRDIDELEIAIKNVNAAEEKVKKLKEMQKDTVTYGAADSQEQKNITMLLNAAEKELDYATQKMGDAFAKGITRAQEYFDQANLAATANGTTESRLTIIQNRLSENRTTVRTQASKNEDVEISDVTVEVSAAQLAYNAALIATGKISQQSLVNYI